MLHFRSEFVGNTKQLVIDSMENDLRTIKFRYSNQVYLGVKILFA